MYCRILLLILTCTFPIAVFAFEATVECTVYVEGKNGPLPGALVTPIADPLWGWPDEAAFKNFEDREGPMPDLEIEGTGKADEKGKVSFRVKVKPKGEGALPTREVRRNRKTVEVAYVALKGRITHERHKPLEFPMQLDDGGTFRTPRLAVREIDVVLGRVLDAEGKPVAGAPLLFDAVEFRWTRRKPAECTERSVWLSTDAAGRFSLELDSPRSGSLRLDDGKLSFEPDAKSWRYREISGIVDLGDLRAVPGGGFACACTDVDTGAAIGVMWELGRPRHGLLASGAAQHGKIDVRGFPPGTYSLTLKQPSMGCGARVDSFEIKPGEVTDLGSMKLEPFRAVKLAITDETGKPMTRAVNVQLVLEQGRVPPPFQPTSQNVKFARFFSWTPDAPAIEDLFAGTWRITFDSRDHALTSMIIDVPATGSVNVQLALGGTMEATLNLPQDYGGVDGVLAVSEESPDYAGYAKLATVKEAGETLLTKARGMGVFQLTHKNNFPPMREDRLNVLTMANTRLPAGRYLFVAIGESGILRRAGIEIRAGETTAFTITPEPIRLVVTLTRAGVPAIGQSVNVIEGQSTVSTQARMEATTNSEGEAQFSDLKRAWYTVLHPAEAAYAASGRELRTEHLAHKPFLAGWGEPIRVVMELEDPSRIWVIAKVSAPGLATPATAMLFNARAPENHNMAVQAALDKNGEFRFLPVAAGPYELVTWFKDRSGNGAEARRRVEITKGPECSIEAQFAFASLTVAAPLPETLAGLKRLVVVRRADDSRPAAPAIGNNDEGNRGVVGRQSITEGDETIFPLVLEGEYIVILRVHDGRKLLHAASARVTSRGPSRVTLAVNEDTGQLSVEVFGTPAMIRPDAQAIGIVTLSAKDGKPVPLADPDQRWFDAGQGAWLTSVPAGTYTVSIAAQGLLPASQADVVVRKGEQTVVRLTPSQAGCMLVTLGGKVPPEGPSIAVNRRLRLPVEVIFEDAKGGVIAPTVAGVPVHWFEYTGGGARLYVHSMVKEVARVRIRVEGCAEATLPVTVEYGRVILTEVELAEATK